MLDEFAHGRQQRKLREVFGFGGDLISDRVVARAAAAAQSFTGPMFPPVGGGMARWMFSVAYLGEATVDLGYRRCDADLVSKVRHDDRLVAIVPAAGNLHTGLSLSATNGSYPKTKWPKGEKTAAAIDVNQQLSLFGGASRAKAEELERKTKTFMLLVHATAREVRAELSEPIGRDSRGYVNAWGDRYLFPPLQFESVDPDLPFDDGDFGPDFNIDIDPR